MPEPLTSIEQQILDYLIEYLRLHTYQPSIREIGRRFDIKSTKTVSELLQSLADKGWIERDPSRSRGVRLLGIDLGADTYDVPCYTELGPDGRPDELAEPFDVFGVDRRLVGSSNHYFLIMKGESMSGAGIRDGDLLLVTPIDDDAYEDGDTVVAKVAGETAVKHFHLRDGMAVLEPANPDYSPILIGDRADVSLAGRVDAVVRRLGAAVSSAEVPAAHADAGRSLS